MKKKPLACPFCKSTNTVVIPRDITVGGWQVICLDKRGGECGVEGPISISAEGAVRRWNRVSRLLQENQ